MTAGQQEPRTAPPVGRASRPAVLCLGLAAVLTIPTSFLSGILFTLTGAMLKRHLGPEARTVGLLTLSNTAGAGLGPLIAGFVLLPTLGMEMSFFVLSASYAAVAALLFAARAPRWRPVTRWVAAGLFLVVVVRFPFGLLENEYIDFPIRRSTPVPMETIAFREGRSETLIYLRSEFLEQTLGYKLITDGYGMAGTFLGARRYMKLFVYWPVAMHANPRTALLISYGTGSTARALVETPGLERIDVVDTSREILEMSEIVYPESGRNPLDDERVRVHVEDGRYFLQTTRERYDLITGEPPPPKMGGVVYLYTREYFQLIHDRLTEGGINTYWLPVTNLTDDDARAIMRAYCDVFEDCSLWAGFRLNWMLAGSRNAWWERSDASFARQWSEPDAGTELRMLGFESPAQIGATFLADSETLAELTSDLPPLTDDRPKRLSDHHSGLTRGVDVFRSWMNTSVVAERFARSAFMQRAWPESLRSETREAFEYQRIVNEIYAKPPIERTAGQRMADLHALIGTNLRTLVLWEIGLGSDEMRIIEGLLAAGNAPPAMAFPMAARAMAIRDFSAAAGHFAIARRGGGQEARALQLQLYALCMAGRKEEAQAIALEYGSQPDATDIDPTYWDWMRETFGLEPD